MTYIMLMDQSFDWCGLCRAPLSKHEVMTEKVVVNGKEGVRPIGWACLDVAADLMDEAS